MLKSRTLSSVTLAIALVLTLAGSSHGQNITLDWGGSTAVTTSTGLSPYSAFWSQAREQYLILKSDIVATGLNPSGPVGITGLSFYITSPIGAGCQNWTIKMKNTAATNVLSFDNVGLQQVYGPINMTPAIVTTGWFKNSFIGPFLWDGVSNILVDVCHDNGNSNYTSTWGIRYGTPVVAGTTNRYCYYYNDYMTGTMCTTTSYYTGSPANAIPNMQLEACSNSATTTTVQPDAQGTVPGSFQIPWSIFNGITSFTSSLSVQLYTPTGTPVGDPQGIASIPVVAGVTKAGTFVYDATNVAPGFYRVEVSLVEINVCGLPQVFKYSKTILLLAPGTQLCNVWPGDVNNDGIVNYGDRKSLNTYIYDANLRTTWLNGPTRYRADFATNPMTYMTWEEQPGIPWNTPEGCYMDADGNGVVNNFDYITVKLNWMKNHAMGKDIPATTASTFDMVQNYPNPFNPTTTIGYTVPEPTMVRLVVVDMSGRTVATLVDGAIEAGTHQVSFDASNLPSGQYMAKVSMTGNETGLTFSKTIKMTLSK